MTDASKIAALLKALKSQVVWIEHWQRDRLCNLPPTEGSLASARQEIITTIEIVEANS